MKRHVALEPFSRDHNVGLQLARELKEERPTAVEHFLSEWTRDLEDHFVEEERLLVGLCSPALGERLVQEHEAIREMVSRLPLVPSALGVALEEHIRWEERVLFPAIELELTEESAAQLQTATLQLEKRRWQGDPVRQKLVKRRLGEDS